MFRKGNDFLELFLLSLYSLICNSDAKFLQYHLNKDFPTSCDNLPYFCFFVAI